MNQTGSPSSSFIRLLRRPFHSVGGPRRLALSAPDLARIAVFAALICALGTPSEFHMFGSLVPITLQTLGIMLAGSLLGAWQGMLAVLVYLAIGAAGMPVFAGKGGLGTFAGVTAGYLIAFPIAAAVIGLIVSRMHRYNQVVGFLANVVGGILVVYAIGIPVLAWRAGLEFTDAVYTGGTIFLPGDLIKAVLATVVAAGVYRAYPPLAESRERRRTESARP